MLLFAAVEHGYVKSTLGTVGALALTCKYISLTPEKSRFGTRAIMLNLSSLSLLLQPWPFLSLSPLLCFSPSVSHFLSSALNKLSGSLSEEISRPRLRLRAALVGASTIGDCLRHGQEMASCRAHTVLSQAICSLESSRTTSLIHGRVIHFNK